MSKGKKSLRNRERKGEWETRDQGIKEKSTCQEDKKRAKKQAKGSEKQK